MAAVTIDNLSFTYPARTEPTLCGLSLIINQGEFCALIGNNGSGKTSLCKALNGLIPHFHRGDFQGSVHVGELETTSSSVGALSFHVGYVYQDFENQLLRPKVRDDVAFAPLNFGLEDFRERADRALGLLGLNELADRFVWELSGGEKHLVALAGVLSLDPRIVVVDEPVAQLDPVNAAVVYERLAELHRNLGKTVIVIEHYTQFIAEYCTSVVMLHDGSVAWKRSVSEALSDVEELARHDIYPPQVTQIAYGMRIDGHRLPITLDETVEALTSRGGVTRAAEAPSERPTVRSGRDTMIRIDSLSFDFPTLDRGERTVIRDLSLEIRDGERVALVGSNGAGKSTLLRLIAGIAQPCDGAVVVSGRDTRKLLPEEMADVVSFVYQNPEEMFIDDSIRRDIEYYPKAIGRTHYKDAVDMAIERFRLSELAEYDGRLVSGGQRRRVSLAIGTVARPAVLLLDEPTSSLDVANRRDVKSMLGELSDWVRITIIATHDMELVADWADRIVVLEEGVIVYDGTPREVFSNPALVERARIRVPQVVELSRRLGVDPVFLTVDEIIAAKAGVQ